MQRRLLCLGALAGRAFLASSRALTPSNNKHRICHTRPTSTLKGRLIARHMSRMANQGPRKPFVVRFYTKAGEGQPATRDYEGRTLEDMLKFNSRELEYHHDYIQYLFPLPEMSMVNPEAPLIDLDTYREFRNGPELRARLLMAFKHMAAFYGFDVSGSEKEPVLTPKDNFEKVASRSWLTNFDHNHLRITRIIRCLRVLGLEEVAAAFYKALEEHARNIINSRSRSVWTKAATRPLNQRPDSDSPIGVKWLYDELNGS